MAAEPRLREDFERRRAEPADDLLTATLLTASMADLVVIHSGGGGYAGCAHHDEDEDLWFVPAMVAICACAAIAYPLIIPRLLGDPTFAETDAPDTHHNLSHDAETSQTARAEYRLSLRADNATTRLGQRALAAGCVSEERRRHIEQHGLRPADIGADNTVRSDRVANARIHYGGKGAVADASAQGWLGRFFNSSWFPF